MHLKLLEIAIEIFKYLMGTAEKGYIPNSAMPHPALPAQPVARGGEAKAQTDRLLIKRTLYHMTVTDNTALQAKNRVLTEAQVLKLTQVDQLMCQVEVILGQNVNVHSGYRSPELNGVTPGSAKKSQHMLCEACDWSIEGAPGTAEAVEIPFQKIWAAAKEGRIKFGQLIVETADRSYGKVYWIHISLGLPYRDPARCGEVLRMVPGPDGKPVYTLIGKV
jgi:hypothetical protein